MLDIKFHDLSTNRVSFVCDLFEDKNVDIKNFVKELLYKRTLTIAKAIP